MIQRPTFASDGHSSIQRPTYQPDSPSGVSLFGEELKRLTGDCKVRMVRYPEEEIIPNWSQCAQFMDCDDMSKVDLEVCCPPGQAILKNSALRDGCVPIPQHLVDKYDLTFPEGSSPPSAPPSASNCGRTCKDHGGGCILDSGAERVDSLLKPGQKAYQIVCRDSFVFESFGDKDASGNLVFVQVGDLLSLSGDPSLLDLDDPGAETTSEDKKKSSVGMWVLGTLGLVGVGAAGWWYSQRRPARNPTPPPARPRPSTSPSRPLPSRPSPNGVSSW
jgi:hypothetical protein